MSTGMTTRELPPKYDPAATETAVYQRWMDAGVFTADNASDRTPYVIVIPPPNVTAVLHMGHGLNNTLQDVLIRFERMRGRESLWLPGTDHAGIATQNVVERMLATEGKTRHDVGREAFVARVWQHVQTTGGTILEQLKAIGASCDWSRTRFTFDEPYSAAVRKVFVSLHRDGLVYRGHRVIHWCPRCHTALSDEEAEFHEEDSKLYFVKYALADKPGADVVVATTRPETIFADIGLVFHPDDERFDTLAGGAAEIPLTGIRIPISGSERVEREFGTGMLKVTPAHDANDFDIANELGWSERPVVITEDATMSAVDRVPPPLHGLDVKSARKSTVSMLENAGRLAKVEPYHHRIRRCYRCDTVVEPRLSDQWFVRMKPLAVPALRAYKEGKIRFIPERWGKVYENWLNDIRDWNISRQLWWGHRIPAWYCQSDSCGEITVSETEPDRCHCGGALVQDEDVLDTWFSSWLWPFATFGWPEETDDLRRFYPGNTLVTGPDIIFFWVARMIMAGYHFLGERPFETVYLNGIVRDTQHRKMSKSLGNGIDPLDVVRLFGADALRFTVISSAATGADVILDPNDLDTSFAVGRNFANKIWNVGRFILSNLEGAEVALLEQIQRTRLQLADRWILARTQQAVRETTDLLNDFRFAEAASTVYHFFWDDLADWYVEQVKPRLYGAIEGGDEARSVLVAVFETALTLLHPFSPFITEELWQHLPGERTTVLASSPWPIPAEEWMDSEAVSGFAAVQALVGAVRSIRADYHVPPGSTVPVVVDVVTGQSRDAFASERATIERLAKIEPLQLDSNAGEQSDRVGAHAVLPDGCSVFVPLGGAIDVAKECSRLTAERDRLDKQLAGLRAKLENAQFVSRAPADIVERERQKEKGWSEQRDTLAAKLRSLGC